VPRFDAVILHPPALVRSGRENEFKSQRNGGWDIPHIIDKYL
jgi:hypothetical protein